MIEDGFYIVALVNGLQYSQSGTGQSYIAGWFINRKGTLLRWWVRRIW